MGANFSLYGLCKKEDIDLGGWWGEKHLGGVVEEGNSDQNILYEKNISWKIKGKYDNKTSPNTLKKVDDFQAGVVALILLFS